MPDRARVYTCEGVVLRRRTLGDADSVLTVFSETRGKFDAVARGVRKAKSHMRGHLEPLTRSRFLIARGHTLDIFTQAETLTAYRGIREDLERGAAALYAAELVDRSTADGESSPEIYWLLVGLLDALEAGAGGQVMRFFELHLLSEMGYDVQLDRCAVCSGRIVEGDALLSPSAGGLVCQDCRFRAGAGRLVSVRGIKVLRYARTTDYAGFAALRLDEGLERELKLALGEVIRSVLDREVNAGRFVEQVARMAAPAAAITPDDVQ